MIEEIFDKFFKSIRYGKYRFYEVDNRNYGYTKMVNSNVMEMMASKKITETLTNEKQVGEVYINKKDYTETLKLVDKLVSTSSNAVSEALFNAAVNDTISNLIDIQSTPIDLVSFTRKLRLYNYQNSIDELIEEVKNIKIEEVINFLKSLKKNGSYALLGTKEVQQS